MPELIISPGIAKWRFSNSIIPATYISTLPLIQFSLNEEDIIQKYTSLEVVPDTGIEVQLSSETRDPDLGREWLVQKESGFEKQEEHS